MHRRFTVEEDTPESFAIVDGEHGKWRLPRQAVSIYFSRKTNADAVCEALNKEWESFLRNPK